MEEVLPLPTPGQEGQEEQEIEENQEEENHEEIFKENQMNEEKNGGCATKTWVVKVSGGFRK